MRRSWNVMGNQFKSSVWTLIKVHLISVQSFASVGPLALASVQV